jgi:hypothetical protein
MTLATPVEGSPTNVLRFVDCCTGAEILFRGSLPIVNGQVFSYIGTSPFVGSGGNLEPNRCYTIYQEYTTDPITYPPAPTLGLLSLKESLGCEDPTCPDCAPPLPCECPEGFTQVGNECIQTTTTTAEYSGQLFELESGDKNQAYCDQGLRLYPNITSLTWPLLGDGLSNAAYTVEQNNGAGPVVLPIGNVLSEVWGKGTNPCSTGSTGGRLNIAGVWAPGFPPNQELSFEFCITVEGDKAQEYLIGIAGDNYIKFYIDGNLAVFLDTPGSGITVPFRYWHVFPLNLSPGSHTIKLAGLNLGGDAAFAAEIYDITLAQFQATLMAPAIIAGNCGTTPAQLAPYIIFSTQDMVGQSVPNPSVPGVWSCPDGGDVDFCNGVPTCTITQTITLLCDCYLIIPCDGTEPFVSSNADLENYIDGFHTVISPDYTGCAYITKLEDTDCKESIDVTVDPDLECDCDLQCYYVSNSNGFLYVDENNILQEVSVLDAQPYIKVCSKIYPLVENESSNYEILNLGLCENNECPVECFKLTNCTNPEVVIYTTSQSLVPYIYGSNNVVKILNRGGCWIASELEDGEICDCPIDITVTTSYATCPDCVGYTSYKLTSCTNNDVIYTLLNLEAYIGQTVRLDCGCYSVEQLNYLPPNPQVIKLEDIYTNCIECTRTYWKLTDCAGEATPIITYTDLSLYEKQVVKIENCDECWIVESTQEHLNATTVVVTESHADCEDCGVNLPCECTILTNYGDCNRTYGYLDCDNTYHEFTLKPGESSDRVCAKKWYVIPFCECFRVKVSIETAPGQFTSQVYTARVTDQILNCYPVYTYCLGDKCGTVSFNGTDWVIYDAEGVALYKLIPVSDTCVYGRWVTMDGQPIPSIQIESYACLNITCNCIDFTISIPGEDPLTINLTIVSYDSLGNPVYMSQDGRWEINFDSKNNCWQAINAAQVVVTICDVDCPVGVWSTFNPTSNTYTSTNCTVPPIGPELTTTDFFQTFGECQNGVCLPPTFKNNRTVKPGYNTPGCSPDEYDKITCKFADVLYKIVLEKRYGITNCCPEDDEKWLLKKELIDLQALKDPNYKCPSCPCSCNSGKTYSTCNCGN